MLTGNISDGVTFPTKTSHQNFIVLFNVIETTVPRYEGGDLLTVLDKLHSDALSDSRVRLLGFNTTAKQKLQIINKTIHKGTQDVV